MAPIFHFQDWAYWAGALGTATLCPQTFTDVVSLENTTNPTFEEWIISTDQTNSACPQNKDKINERLTPRKSCTQNLGNSRSKYTTIHWRGEIFLLHFIYLLFPDSFHLTQLLRIHSHNNVKCNMSSTSYRFTWKGPSFDPITCPLHPTFTWKRAIIWSHYMSSTSYIYLEKGHHLIPSNVFWQLPFFSILSLQACQTIHNTHPFKLKFTILNGHCGGGLEGHGFESHRSCGIVQPWPPELGYRGCRN